MNDVYRRKPSEIRAWQFMADAAAFQPDWVQRAFEDGRIHRAGNSITVYADTGPARAHFGDWLIQAADGRVWPCADDHFRESYEPVSGAAAR